MADVGLIAQLKAAKRRDLRDHDLSHVNFNILRGVYKLTGKKVGGSAMGSSTMR